MKSANRANLSLEIADQIRAAIVEGELSPGERLNEVHLARQLAVSRTPIREALSRLASEGMVKAEPRLGFYVREFSAEEIEDHHLIRSVLDPAALQLTGIPDHRTLDALHALNGKIAVSAGDARRTVELDDEWHLLLLEGCPNGLLLKLIRQFMQRRRLFELSYLSDRRNVEVSVGEHDVIIHTLRRGKLDRAVDALRINLQSAVGPIVQRLAST
ncbi:MAG: GntR family transcriptional regulator [Gemmatimonadota bacterium]